MKPFVTLERRMSRSSGLIVVTGGHLPERMARFGSDSECIGRRPKEKNSVFRCVTYSIRNEYRPIPLLGGLLFSFDLVAEVGWANML
jgi:hypothetical protein